MKIKFDTLEYQTKAVESVIKVFDGQKLKKSNFTITNSEPQGTLFASDGIGISNKIIIDPKQMLTNVNKTQIINGILPSDNLYGNNSSFPQFNIEMETGTGKTFVYLKSILELNKKYGFLKFVIVVPSVAIREGVFKSFRITKQYFKKQYNGVIYDMFMFDSSKLDRVKSFASSNTIDIMVTTIQSFNKDTNVMNQENDQLAGMKPIDLIAETRPILIIDEPQSVDNTDKAKSAISTLTPSVGFRYSATHKDQSYPTIYKLGAVEAYDNQLVKQIEVATVQRNNDGNQVYLRLKDVKTNNSGISAHIEVYKKSKDGAVKKTIKVKERDEISVKTKLNTYDEVGFVKNIDATPGNEAVYFSGKPEKITLEEATLEDIASKKEQIKQTIKEHLDKELQFKKSGQNIKVLSLFFLDKVENYRVYDENGKAEKGKYAEMFEKEYESLIKRPEYKILNDIKVPVDEVHDGYFSKDKKGKLKDTNGSTIADESTYETIMKNKEGLLTIYNPAKGYTDKASKIRFIFSHSALKEGWDNPNVFQIATLIESKDNITKRQKIGRGLRIAVNQEGERVPGFQVNTLTVMANESYKDFADGLQKEYEEDGIVFGKFNKDSFATIILSHDEQTDELEILGKEKSEELFNELLENNFINTGHRATDKLKKAIIDKKIDVSEEFLSIKPQILEVAATKVKNLDIKNAGDKVLVKVKNEVPSEAFLELWNKIKYKTTYKIHFDSNKLIHDAVNGNSTYDGINKIQTRSASYLYQKGNVEITDAGIKSNESSERNIKADVSDDYVLPDIITFLQNETKLTRKTIVSILTKANNLDNLKKNPLSYMTQAAKIINKFKNQLIIDGIEYKRVDDFYEQKLFSTETLYGYLGENGNVVDVPKDSDKTVYDCIVTDSSIEKEFAENAENDENVRFYVKLPGWFKIRTPLGPYNPDWAILYEEDDEQHLYFIVETKGDVSDDQLRPHEKQKIDAGEKHFKAVDTDIKFKRVSKENEIRE